MHEIMTATTQTIADDYQSINLHFKDTIDINLSLQNAGTKVKITLTRPTSSPISNCPFTIKVNQHDLYIETHHQELTHTTLNSYEYPIPNILNDINTGHQATLLIDGFSLSKYNKIKAQNIQNLLQLPLHEIGYAINTSSSNLIVSKPIPHNTFKSLTQNPQLLHNYTKDQFNKMDQLMHEHATPTKLQSRTLNILIKTYTPNP